MQPKFFDHYIPNATVDIRQTSDACGISLG